MTITLDSRRLVVGMTWPQFLEHMRIRWEPGQHIAMIGPTGEGKSTFAGGLLSLRDYVLAFDPKGEDTTLSATGYERVLKLPNEIDWQERLFRSQHARQWDRIHTDIAEGRPAKLIVGGPSRTVEQDTRNQSLMHRAFQYAREAGGWTVYVDEFELISSQRQFNLGKWVERMLISARSEGTSVVTSFQAAAWVSKHATRQARMTVMWPTGDRDMIKAVAASMGRDWRQVAAAVDELPQYHVVVIPRGKTGGPLICTSAPKL
jgi:hypothetical protein